jgi:hypothetical protein
MKPPSRPAQFPVSHAINAVTAPAGILPLAPPLPARDSPSPRPCCRMILQADSHDPEGRIASSRGQSHEPGTGQLIDQTDIPVASSKERDNRNQDDVASAPQYEVLSDLSKEDALRI